MAAARRPFIKEEHAMVRQRHFVGHRHRPRPISTTSNMVWWRARHGQVMTTAVRSPVRPATRWIRVVSIASARVIAGRMVVSRRASTDLPAPGGPRRRTLWSQRLHRVQLHPCPYRYGCRSLLTCVPESDRTCQFAERLVPCPLVCPTRRMRGRKCWAMRPYADNNRRA
jgi:hypothetical protein